MRRVDARQVISPETQLRDGEQPGEKHAPLQEPQIARPRKNEDQRDQDQSRNQEDTKQVPPGQDADRQKRQQEPPNKAADLLKQLCFSDGARDDLLALRRGQQTVNFDERGHDLRNLLNRAESSAQAACEHRRGNQRRLSEFGVEQFGDTRTFQRAFGLLLPPNRRFGKKRADDDQRNRGNQA